MRISAKSDNAVRAMAELAAAGDGALVRAEDIAAVQGIPVTFLLGILRELRVAHLVRSYRGRGAGFALGRPPEAITIADVIRAVDGPLANVRGLSPDELTYRGSAAPLREVWFAVRGSLREVLEQVTLADLVRTELPANVRFWAARYTAEQAERGWTASVS